MMDNLPQQICLKLLLQFPNLEIDSNILDLYVKEYSKLTNGSIPKASNLRYAKKLAAINIIKFKRLIKQKTKAGFVYVITNPAWPEKAKIGFSVDPLERIKTFNTGDPHRAYRIQSWGLFFNARESESLFHEKFNFNLEHEWADLKTYPLNTIIEFIQKNSNTY